MSEVNTTLREATAAVSIVGLLKKKELEIKTTNAGEALMGRLTIETAPGNEVRVDTYVNRMTKATTDKPSKESAVWKNQKRVYDEYVAMADLMKDGADEATARAQATRLSLTARLDLNDYVDRDDNIVSTTRINANNAFFSRISEGQAFDPSARFEVEGYLTAKRPEMKGDDETGRLFLDMIVPGYRGAARPMTFVTTPEAGAYIDDHYEVGTTVHVFGEMVNRANVVTTRKAGFMKEEISESVTYVNEMLIDNGEPEPYDEDSQLAYKRADIENAMRVRELEYLPSVRQRQAERAANKTAAPAGGGFAGVAGKAPRSNTGFTY